jgi:hypothetical protein
MSLPDSPRYRRSLQHGGEADFRDQNRADRRVDDMTGY